MVAAAVVVAVVVAPVVVAVVVAPVVVAVVMVAAATKVVPTKHNTQPRSLAKSQRKVNKMKINHVCVHPLVSPSYAPRLMRFF